MTKTRDVSVTPGVQYLDDHRARWITCGIAAFGTLSATMAYSQDVEPPIVLDPIVIIAERVGYIERETDVAAKTNLPVTETPQAVSVVTTDQLRDRPPRSVQDALQYEPGVFGAVFGNNLRNDFIQIRGFASEQQSFFADGLQLPSFAFATWRLEPFTLTQIEVLRGPSSGLYGASNPGGLINSVTKRADVDQFGEAFAQVDEFGQVRGGLDVNQGFGSFAVRVAATGRVGDTEVDFTDDDGYAIAPSLLWIPTDRTEVELYANVVVDRNNGQNFLPYEGTEERAPFGFIDRDLFTSEPDFDRFERDQWFVGADIRHELASGLAFESSLRYGELEVDYRTLFGGGYAAPPTEDTALLSRFNFTTNPEATLFNFDNRATFSATTGQVTHDLLFGVDYTRYTVDDVQDFAFDAPLDLLDPDYDGPTVEAAPFRDEDIEQTQLGFYVQDAISYGNLRVLATGRLDYVDLSLKSPFNPDIDSDETAFSGRLGALYTFDNGIAPYASISRSFVPVIGVDTTTNDPFESETGTQIEAGIKYDIPGLNSVLSFAAFHIVRDNVLQTDNTFVQRQIGEVTSQGFEVDVRGAPLPGLEFVASATVMDIEVTDGTDIDEGNLPPNTPEAFASAYADYTIQSGTLEGLGAGLGVRYIGRSFADRTNDLEVSDTLLLDAGIHYDLPYADGATLALTGTNLTDERYVASCSSPTACFYGASRRVMLTLGYEW